MVGLHAHGIRNALKNQHGLKITTRDHPTDKNRGIMRISVTGTGSYPDRVHDYIEKTMKISGSSVKESVLEEVAPETELEEKKLVQRIQYALQNRASMAKSFGKNFAHYASNPKEPLAAHPDKYPHQPRIKKIQEELESVLEALGHADLLKQAARKGAEKARRTNQSAKQARVTIIHHISNAHEKFVRAPGNQLRTLGGLAFVAPPIGIMLMHPVAKAARTMDDRNRAAITPVLKKRVQDAVQHGMNHYLRST